MINKKLVNAGSTEVFDYLPNCFVSDITTKRNKDILNTTLIKLFSKNFYLEYKNKKKKEQNINSECEHSQEKAKLYLKDFPLTITFSEIKDFLSKSKYRDKIISINQLESNEKEEKDKKERKTNLIKVLFKDYESADKCRTEMNSLNIQHKSFIMWDNKNLNKYSKNKIVLEYLEKNEEIRKKSNFDIIKNMTYTELFNEFFKSEEFEKDILKLKKKESIEYVISYIKQAYNFTKIICK